MKQLEGSNAILTGASRGLGIPIAIGLAKEGVNIALAARSEDALEEVREKVMRYGVEAVAIPTDLADPKQVENLHTKAEQQLGAVDILVNNAGVELTLPYADYPVEDIQKSVQVNLLGPMLLSRAILPGMLKRGRGHIVNISSLAGKTGLPFQTPYGTTKAGLVMFTHCLRAELMDQPVGASVICPGFVAGDGMYARIEETGERAPMVLRPTSTEKVVKAVINVMKKDIAELIVNPIAMRPGIVLREIFPGITPYLHKVLGSKHFAQKVADKGST